MPKPPKYKRLKNQWTHDAQLEYVKSMYAKDQGFKASEVPFIGGGNKAEISHHLKKALALPAAQEPIFRAASIDKMAEKISANMDAEVDVKTLQEAFPELTFDQIIEVAKLYTDRQGRALDTAKGLIAALVKAQAKQAPGNTVNIQLNTGDVDMGVSDQPPKGRS